MPRTFARPRSAETDKKSRKTRALPAAKKSTTKPKMRRAPASTASEHALATCVKTPVERRLTSQEREAMQKVADTVRRFLKTSGPPEATVRDIVGYLDAVRAGTRPPPRSQDIRLGLGVLWGDQVRAEVGWRWVHLTYSDGFASYAIVPNDRAFACFPLNRVPELLTPGPRPNTTGRLFHLIREGSLPLRRKNAYLVIG